MSDTTQTPKPFMTESESSALVLESYLLTMRHRRCIRCNHNHISSEVHEVWVHPIKTALSAYRNLKSARTMQPNLPVAYVNAAQTEVPICHFCIHTYNVPQAPQAPISETEWAQTLKRKAQEAIDSRKAVEAKARTAYVPSLGEL